MGSKRRYKIGLKPIYDNEFNLRRVGSRILNSGSMMPGINTIFWDKRNCQSHLAELEGNSEGFYYKGNQRMIADIPNALRKLEALQKRFENYQQERVNLGYRKPEEWPSGLDVEKQSLEAQLDVMYEEVEVVKGHLNDYIEAEKTVHNGKMLLSGPRGNGRLQGGVLIEIDDQNVGQINGHLVIVDEDSPYHGISVPDYREYISEPWAKATLEISNEQYKKRQELIEKGVSSDRIIREEYKKVETEMHERHPEWESLFSLRIDGKPPMPEVQEHLKRYL